MACCDAAGFGSFHLEGYSGGAAICLAGLLAHGRRLQSVALIEPAWIGKAGWTTEEVQCWAKEDRNMALAEPDFMKEFVRTALRPGVPLPPLPERIPDWMAKPPAGLQAFRRAFKTDDLDHGRLKKFAMPLYIAFGELSNVVEEIKAKRLAAIFPNCQIEMSEGTHPFAPPQRLQPERFARALHHRWAKSEGEST